MEHFGRYLRQIDLPELGIEAQKRLSASSVAIIGAGGLGSPLLMYLAAAGVGHLYVFDHDYVEVSNLNRQILYTERDLGKQKVIAAKDFIQRLNSDVVVHSHNTKVEESFFDFNQVDIIADASDNFETRYFLNACSIKHHKPLIHASVYGMEGRITSFLPGETACYRCLYPNQPSASGSTPVLGVSPGVGGIMQASEIINYLISNRLALAGKLLVYDLYDMTFDTISILKDEHCLDCGRRT